MHLSCSRTDNAARALSFCSNVRCRRRCRPSRAKEPRMPCTLSQRSPAAICPVECAADASHFVSAMRRTAKRGLRGNGGTLAPAWTLCLLLLLLLYWLGEKSEENPRPDTESAVQRNCHSRGSLEVTLSFR